MMNNRFAAYILGGALFVACATTACQQATTTNTNTASEVSSASATPAGGNDNLASVAATPVATVSAPVAGSTPGSAVQAPTRPADTHDVKPLQPQVGSGGNDFYLFTQARAALNADEELKKAALTLEVHASVATLTGTVRNDEQKQRAARLVQNTQGMKAVNNELRVAGSAK